jgi:RNA polymerase sigma-70 factor (ECF subfamily)
VTGTGPCPAAAAPTVGAPRRHEGAVDDAEAWLSPLRSAGEERELAVARLHGLLLRAARFEAARRRPGLPGVGSRELDDLAVQAADDALVAVLARLDTFRGASRFTTWAYKFAVYQTSVTLRRHAWRDREVLLEPQSWAVLPDRGTSPQQHAEAAEVAAAVRAGIAALTPHQRDVLVALVLNEVPIDVLADRLGTTRGALYKTLHDARRKLRGRLAELGIGAAAVGTAEETR